MFSTIRTVIACLLIGCGLSAPQALAQKQSPASGAVTTASSPAPPGDIAQKADQAREAGRLEEAIDLYRLGLKAQPKWLEGWWYLGTLLYDRDRYADAKLAFDQVVALEPKNGTPLAMLALCEFNIKEYEQSLEHLDKARGLGVSDNVELMSVVRYHHGILLTRFGHFAEGHQALLYLARYQNGSPKVIEAFGLNVLEMPYFPGDTPADQLDLVTKTGRAIFCMLARRPVEADEAFQTLLAKYPALPKLHYFYGVFLITDRSDDAIAQFKKELEVSPENVFALLALASEYINRNDYATGFPYAQQAVEIAPGQAAPHLLLGRILVETGKAEEGIGQLELAERFDPNNSKVHFALAHAYSRLHRTEEAQKERERFMVLDAAEREKWGKDSVPAPGQGDRPSDKPADKPQK
jgi:tetratricopeptide (TPR) repeat protein